MPITAADLKFFDSERMTDDANAGGRRGANALLTGEDNNVWPPITEDDSLLGARHLRKIYPSVVADSADPLRSATAVVDSLPEDDLVHVAMIQNGDQNTVRSTVAALAPVTSTVVLGYNASLVPLTTSGTIDGGDTTLTISAFPGRSTLSIAVGSYVRLTYAGGVHIAVVMSVAAGGSASDARDVEIGTPFPGSDLAVAVTVEGLTVAATPRAYGCCALSGEQTSAAEELTLQTDLLRLSSSVVAKAFAAGDVCTIWNEAETTPASQVNTDVINAGRTNLSQLALVDNNDEEIARAYANGPTVSGVGATFNLAAGTVTCTDVSGWAQPVRLRHRIEQRVGITAVSLPTLSLSAPLDRTFAAGSYLSSEVPLGTLEGAVPLQFSQQAWTRVWSDAVIGAAVGTLYTGSIPLTAEGAETDRWACVFSSATQYTLHSERWGVVGTGNVGSDFIPLSPATNQPLLTLLAAGWALGSIAVGYVFRFNTTGSYAPVWANRYAEPGATAGAGSVRLRLRGSIDA